MPFECVRCVYVCLFVAAMCPFYKVVKCSISLSIIFFLYLPIFFALSPLPPFSLLWSLFFWIFHILLYFATYLSPLFRWSHMPQCSICCTDASNASLCKIFSIFKKLLCERNFIFMTFLYSYLLVRLLLAPAHISYWSHSLSLVHHYSCIQLYVART